MFSIGAGSPRAGALLVCVVGLCVGLVVGSVVICLVHSVCSVVLIVTSVNSCVFSSGYRSQSMMSLLFWRDLGNECIRECRFRRA